MNDLVPLHFESGAVRMVMLDGEPWWVLADVAAALGLSNATKTANRLENYQKADLTIREGSSGQRRRVNVVNEAGVYTLTLNSRKPAARAFAHWLFTAVLPSVRKWGCYPPPAASAYDEERGQSKLTAQQRFISECHRAAKELGFTVADLLKHIVSPQQQRAIELGHGPMEDLLHRGKRWLWLMGAGIDLQYVLSGHWSVTPRERDILKQLRADPGEQKHLTSD